MSVKFWYTYERLRPGVFDIVIAGVIALAGLAVTSSVVYTILLLLVSGAALLGIDRLLKPRLLTRALKGMALRGDTAVVTAGAAVIAAVCLPHEGTLPVEEVVERATELSKGKGPYYKFLIKSLAGTPDLRDT